MDPKLDLDVGRRNLVPYYRLSYLKHSEQWGRRGDGDLQCTETTPPFDETLVIGG
jgi:hypothetical protein